MPPAPLNIGVETPNAQCSRGMVRLVNGSNELEGRLEICINNAWGTVCQQGFSSDDARIVCINLGLLNDTSNVVVAGFPGLSKLSMYACRHSCWQSRSNR